VTVIEVEVPGLAAASGPRPDDEESPDPLAGFAAVGRAVLGVTGTVVKTAAEIVDETTDEDSDSDDE